MLLSCAANYLKTHGLMLIVQKFGGTSVANIERIRNAALKVQREHAAGHRVAVVVSAMSGVTNQLVGYVQELSPLMSRQAWCEYDQVVSSGEQVTSGLLALCLQEMGIPGALVLRLAGSSAHRCHAWQSAH